MQCIIFFYSSIYLTLPFSSFKTFFKLVNCDAVKKTISIYTTLPVLWPSVSEPNKGQFFSWELFACVEVIKRGLIPFFLKLFKIWSVIQTREVWHKWRLHWNLKKIVHMNTPAFILTIIRHPLTYCTFIATCKYTVSSACTDYDHLFTETIKVFLPLPS